MFITIKYRRLSDVFLALLLLSAAVLILRSAVRLRAAEAVSLEAPVCLVIDPGHGGIDGGAIAVNGIKESEINLSIALRLQKLAELTGIETVMTRTDDSRRTDILSYSEHEDLVYRTEIVNALPNAVLISIHQNTYPTSQPWGAQVLYASGEESRRLGELLHRNLVSNLQPENRRLAEPASPGLYITANVNCPAVLVECGFLSNHSEIDRLIDPDYQTSLAAVMLASYLQYLPNHHQT